MTATDPAPLVCPQCGGINTSVGGSGSGMCFECAHMWDPAEVVGLPRAKVEPFAMAPVDEVFDASDAGPTFGETTLDTVMGNMARMAETGDPDKYQVVLAELVGGFATLEGGQVAQVVTFTDDERVVVTFASGDTGVVPLSDVERIVPPAPPAEVNPPADELDAPPPEMQATMLMASQIIDAGIRAAHTIENPGTLLDIPTGYLPDDPALWPIVEQACAVAIGMMIDATDMGVAGFAGFFGIDLDADTGDQQQEDTTDEQGSSEDE